MTNTITQPIITSIPFKKDDIDLIKFDRDEMIDDVDIQIPDEELLKELDDDLLDDEGCITDAGWTALARMDANGDFV